jgi:MATE family multidrug resistance protein
MDIEDDQVSYNFQSIKSEVFQLFEISYPVLISGGCRLGMAVTDNIFVGKIGPKEMAASVLGDSWSWGMIYIGVGISFALDTFVSQAFGAMINRELEDDWCKFSNSSFCCNFCSITFDSDLAFDRANVIVVSTRS